jgi:two-component system OmpR family response regulator
MAPPRSRKDGFRPVQHQPGDANRNRWRTRTIDLTTAEFDLLWLLATHAGNVLSRDDLLQELRGIGFDGLDRSIDARISRLRKKLNDDPENPTRIKTVRGKGYLFSKHDWN